MANQWNRTVWGTALLFGLLGLALQWWRMSSLTSSMDQGILFQILWNGLHGHPFESTLSSQLSTNVVHAGELPRLGYHRLGQHFTPILLLWMPLIAAFGKWVLPMLQVVLITGAGLLLYQLAKGLVNRQLATMLTLAFYGANAVIGPMLGNFADFSQLPFAVFALLLGLQQRRSWLIAIAALAIPLIREDTGVLLVGVGIWLAVRDRSRRWLAALLMLWGGGYVLLATNVFMPLFSEDSSKRFMMENYGSFVEGQGQASSLEVLGQVLQKPLLLLQELIDPPGKTLRYFAGMGLPLLFIPFIALDSWLLMALPLMGVLLASSFNDPLSLSIRYTYLVVPGLFAGAVYWWSRHQELFEQRRFVGRLHRAVAAAGPEQQSQQQPLAADPRQHQPLELPLTRGAVEPRSRSDGRHQHDPRGSQRECQHSTDSSFGRTAGADPLPVSRGLHRSCRG